MVIFKLLKYYHLEQSFTSAYLSDCPTLLFLEMSLKVFPVCKVSLTLGAGELHHLGQYLLQLQVRN